MLPMRGAKGPVGERMKKGFQLALKDLEGEGIHLEPVWIDEASISLSDPGEKVEGVLQDPNLLAMVGGYSSEVTYRLSVLAQKCRIPFIISSAMADRLTRQGFRWVFRICPSGRLFIRGFLSFLAHLNLSSIALLYEDTPWGRTLCKKVEHLLRRQAYLTISSWGYTPGASTYEVIVHRLEVKAPEGVLLLSSPSDTLQLTHHLSRKGLSLRVVAGLNLALSLPSFMEDDIGQAMGLVFPTIWIPYVPYAEGFVKKYRATYDESPDYHAAEAYSALYLLGGVLEKVGDTNAPGLRRQIRKSLEKGSFDTPLGSVKFQSGSGYTHQNMVKVLVVQVQREGIRVVYPPSAATGGIKIPRDKGQRSDRRVSWPFETICFTKVSWFQ